ncbi:MAG: hypothetical protein IAE81_17420 [Caldilineaceae bacterium]|jgi:hypothetical protein|nr:hypothetical protein [Caldilineaceae bacterium]
MSIFKVLKWTVGGFYLIGGPLIHIYCITQNPAIYGKIAESAWPLYQTLWQTWVLPYLVPLVVLLMVVEATMGALMLSRNSRLARLGQAAGLAFNLLLVPFQFAWGIPNLLTAALHGWLWWREGQPNPQPATSARTILQH